MAPVVRSALQPPLHDRRIWIVRAMVLGLAAAHLAIDMVVGHARSAVGRSRRAGLAVPVIRPASSESVR
jgi:hypothetical protein